MNIIINSLINSINIKKTILENVELINSIEQLALKIADNLKNGRKLLVAGNGGSAGDAQHIVAELVSRFYLERKGLKAIALTTDSSIMTGIGNDYGFDYIFSRQIEAIGDQDDIFLAISTSGNSKNILAGIDMAKKLGLFVIGLTGETGGKMLDLCDEVIRVPSRDTPRIQEVHILIGHILCEIIEHELFGKK